MRKGSGKKWKPILPVLVYKLMRAGLTVDAVCESLGFTKMAVSIWCKKYPELAQAMEMARAEREDASSITDFVFQRLPPELKELWRQIEDLHRPDGTPGGLMAKDGAEQLYAILADSGKTVRQKLFLHALCVCRFSPSAALKRVNVTKRELDQWLACDPDFALLVQEVDWHKQNFYEEMLVQLVRSGDTTATVFANRTMNAGRGYAVKSQADVNIRHSGAVLHGVVDLGELVGELSEACRSELLGAIRNREERESKRISGPHAVPVSAEESMASRISREVDV